MRTWKRYICNSTNTKDIVFYSKSFTISHSDDTWDGDPFYISYGSSIYKKSDYYIGFSGGGTTIPSDVPTGNWVEAGNTGVAYYMTSKRAIKRDGPLGRETEYTCTKEAKLETITTYSSGTYNDTIEAFPGSYPTDGRASDGYWYILQP